MESSIGRDVRDDSEQCRYRSVVVVVAVRARDLDVGDWGFTGGKEGGASAKDLFVFVEK